MGIRVTVYQISPLAFEAAVAGNYESFTNYDMGEPLHIEKAWHAIYYLLTGDTELLLFPSGVAIEIMSEYAEVHSPDSTLLIYNRLKMVVRDYDDQTLNIEALNANEIYPRDWKYESSVFVKSYLDALYEFVGNAVNHGNGLFVFMA